MLNRGKAQTCFVARGDLTNRGKRGR